MLWLVGSDGPFLQTAPSHRDSKESSESEHAYQQLLESHEKLSDELTTARQQLEEECLSHAELEVHTAEEPSVQAGEVEHLREELEKEKDKRKQVWKTSCEYGLKPHVRIHHHIVQRSCD